METHPNNYRQVVGNLKSIPEIATVLLDYFYNSKIGLEIIYHQFIPYFPLDIKDYLFYLACDVDISLWTQDSDAYAIIGIPRGGDKQKLLHRRSKTCVYLNGVFFFKKTPKMFCCSRVLKSYLTYIWCKKFETEHS